MSRTLHLNAFLMSSGHHEAAWRLAESDPHADYDVEHWVKLAQLAERGTMDSVFFADGPSLGRGVEFRPAGQLDPLILLAVMAARTSHVGLITTASTTYNPPYNLARAFASLDHVSGGRAGWNIVTTADRDAAANFGLEDRPDHADRYARATDFVETTLELWDSWDDERSSPTRRQAGTRAPAPCGRSSTTATTTASAARSTSRALRRDIPCSCRPAHRTTARSSRRATRRRCSRRSRRSRTGRRSTPT